MNQQEYINERIEALTKKIAEMPLEEFQRMAASIESLGLEGPTPEEYFNGVQRVRWDINSRHATEDFDDNLFSGIFHDLFENIELGTEDTQSAPRYIRVENGCSGVSPDDCTFLMAA